MLKRILITMKVDSAFDSKGGANGNIRYCSDRKRAYR